MTKQMHDILYPIYMGPESLEGYFNNKNELSDGRQLQVTTNGED